MTFIAELLTISRVTVEADTLKDAEARAAVLAKEVTERSHHGEVTKAILLGTAEQVERWDQHMLQCGGCCPTCNSHCPEFDGVSCGGRS